ncbi:MAG: hypothetical protein FJY91_00465 [Candidatus Harrisonbacteria bacterium]|nr:hypothetical protein [Candidatus Harrisonbacteria bacterium]
MNSRIIFGVLIALVLAALAGNFYLRPIVEGKNLPPEFQQAREDGSLVSKKIVFLSNQALAGLEQIGHFDEKKQYTKALELVRLELKRNEDARKEALLLSSHLNTMSIYLEQISPSRARSLAIEAIGSEVSLVNHLITYHGLLSDLFQTLEEKFEGKTIDAARVKSLLEAVNSEIRVINDLNQRAIRTLESFDSFYK